MTPNPADPFPVSLLVQERTDAQPDPAVPDATPPGEVYLPAIAGSTTGSTLQWIKPKDDDFDRVVICRREHSEPVSHTDGDVVYEGHIPNYCDVSGISAIDYYLIFTVDSSGNRSQGVVLHQVQPER